MGSIKKPQQTKQQRNKELSMEILSSWSLKNKSWEWREYAACLGMTGDLFFGKLGYNKKQIDTAKAVCKSCTVKRACLEYANDNVMTHGVWGGKTPAERLVLLGLKRWPVS